MSTLNLKMESGISGGDLIHGLLAVIYYIPAEGRSKKIQTVPIPVGAGIPFTQVNVSPGNYMIEVRMPSGEILSEEVTLTEKHTEEVTFRLPTDQKNALFGWQDSTDNVMKMNGPQLPAHWADSLLNVLSPHAPAGLDGKPTPRIRKLAGPEEIQVLLWKHTVGNAAGADAAAFLQKLEQSLQDSKRLLAEVRGDSQEQIPAYSNEALNLYRFAESYHGRNAEPERKYALISIGRRNRLLSLPLPWVVDALPGEVELAVRKKKDAAEGEFSLAIRDPYLSAPLAYLASGSANQAADMFNLSLAETLLFEKSLNPIGAALGGYILLLSDQQKRNAEKEQWHQWIENLKKWFPWLPDGAIQYAWLKLDHQQNEDDVHEARKALLLACRLGLPYFTKGMSLLVNGLRLFRDDGDAEASAWLDKLLPIAWRIDMSQVFLALTLADTPPNK